MNCNTCKKEIATVSNPYTNSQKKVWCQYCWADRTWGKTWGDKLRQKDGIKP